MWFRSKYVRFFKLDKKKIFMLKMHNDANRTAYRNFRSGSHYFVQRPVGPDVKFYMERITAAFSL